MYSMAKNDKIIVQDFVDVRRIRQTQDSPLDISRGLLTQSSVTVGSERQKNSVPWGGVEP